MLRDDDARDCFEHLTLAHQWAFIELPGGDSALTGRLRNPHKVFGGVLHVGQVGKRALPCHRHVGVQREV